MSNTVEFILKLKDMMSGGMARAASSAQTSYRRIEDVVSKPVRIAVDTNGLKNAGREVDTLRDKLGRLRDEQGRFAGGSRRGGGGGGGLLGMVGMSGAGAAGLAGLAGVVAGGGYAIGSALQGSQQKASFEVLGGKQQGGQLYGDITKFAQDSIFGNELYKNAQTLLSFGIDVKKVLPDLKMLGDISMGDAEKLGSLTLAFAQTQSAGKLMGQDLLQYVNAGFNPLQELSVMTGKSMATLKDMMSEGAISAEAVGKAFEHATGPGGKFFDMTNKIADTPFGKWEALKGQVQGIALQFGTSLLPAVSKVLNVLPPLLEAITPMLQKLVPVFSSLANICITALVPALKLVGAVLNVLLDIISPVIKGVEWIIDQVAGVFGDGRIEKTYDQAGEISGKAYVGGIADEMKEVKEVVDKSVKAPGITDAWRDAAGQHSKTYMEALKENMKTWDLTVPVTLVTNGFSGKAGLSDYVVNPDGSLSFAKAAGSPVNNSASAQALFNSTFKVGNYTPDPNAPIRAGWDSAGYNPKMPKAAQMAAIRLASSFHNSDSYAGIAPGWLGQSFKDATGGGAKGGSAKLDALLSGVGSDSSSKALQSGGLRSIVFNIDTVGVKGGLTIQSNNLTEGTDEIQQIVTEAMNRALDGVSAPLSH